jgi:hypothetical protein
MALRSPINFSDEDKLEVLQRLDQFRLWHSLDEKRYCLVCGKLIAGQEVHVTGGEYGPLRVSCPTEHCNAIPMNWVRSTDEVLIKIAKLAAKVRARKNEEEIEVEPSRQKLLDSVDSAFRPPPTIPLNYAGHTAGDFG